MVMPRSRSISMESSTCSTISRALSAPVVWIRRSASVDLPWSICATIAKLRMGSIRCAVMRCAIAARRCGAKRGKDAGASAAALEKLRDHLGGIVDHGHDAGIVEPRRTDHPDDADDGLRTVAEGGGD